ncbi:MAG TPA: DUF5996 family protein [Gaiellaceae bacterium]|nr:DUF5996 family protein [Gaiellaceae bacterium]
MSGAASAGDGWPALPYEAWRATKQTLHMELQVVGKLRLALAPMEPQWGQVPLYVTARGLTSSPIPHPSGSFDVDVDLVDHVVSVRTGRGAVERVRLEPRSVADFYTALMTALDRAGVPVEISTVAVEVPDPIPYPEDRVHASYEPEWAERAHRVLLLVDAVLKEHRARFRGKTSPVQFFWGAFDLSYARFSGRLLEPPAAAGSIMRATHDAEQACAGFWPGDDTHPEAAFFAYTWPQPDGIEGARIEPGAAGWSAALGEFLLPYEAVRKAADPRRALLDFLETTYRAGAERAGWAPELAGESPPA